MQAWAAIRTRIAFGAARREWFTRSFAADALITPEQSATVLISRLRENDTGAFWDIGAMSAPA